MVVVAGANERAVRALLISDTHIGGRHASRRLPERVLALARAADVVLHAGDITDMGVLDELARCAPVHAVLGNNDRGLDLPERLTLELGGARVAMVHETGSSTGRGPRLRRWFPDADLVVFGHSHLPWHEADVDDRCHVQHHVNPGSALERRQAPHTTVAVVLLDGGVRSVEHVVV